MKGRHVKLDYSHTIIQRFLDMKIDCKLSFKEHIARVCRKIFKSVDALL